MKSLRMFLPDNLTSSQESSIDRISSQLFSAGWKEFDVREWWQTPMRELNGFCPLEAVANDKQHLAQMSADKTLRLYEAKVNEYADEETAYWLKDRETVRDE